MAARWGYFEDSVRLAAALRPALAARGVPEAIYVDNGSAFVDAALTRAAARLGIKITHSAPGRPQGRGKIERFFGVVRQEFLVEIGDGAGVTDLVRLNSLFTAWYETVYHTRPHSETGQPPIDRWLAGAPFPTPSPAQLREAFLWAEYRVVRKDATIKLFGGAYETDPVLAGRSVECVFDPFDLAIVEVRWNGKPYGLAKPQQIRRHSHPKAKPEDPAEPPPATGIDYLGIIAAEHEEAARRHRIRYDALAEGPGHRARAGGRAVSPQPVRPAEISDLIAWAARLSRTGLGGASPAETAAYLAAKADLLERIAASREQDGWASRDIDTARQAAARPAWPPASPPRRTDMIDLRNHYGFTRTPFGKDLAPSMLHHYPGHAEAVARITWCARERALAVITGEVGAGKTISARAAIAASTRPGTP